MALDPGLAKVFYTALQAAGMPRVPDEFSVVPQHQIIPASIIAEIADFIRAFERVTSRLNALYYEAAGPCLERQIAAPPRLPAFESARLRGAPDPLQPVRLADERFGRHSRRPL